MNRLFVIAATLVTLVIVGCNSMAKTTGKKPVTEEMASTEKPVVKTPSYTEENGMLVGKIDRQQLEEGDYKKWFEPRYDAYKVDNEAVATIAELLDGVEVTIFMGTWCPDSHREVPNFYKVIDATEAAPSVDLFAVTHAKTTPAGFEDGKNIQRVPTFIFTKDGKELGRIVEYPIESLEKDMIKILQGDDYKHAYAE